MLGRLSRWIAGSRRDRYWVRKLTERADFLPVLDLTTNRTVACLRAMSELGFAPEVVVDAGAYRGEWTRMVRPLFPNAHFVMLEAQPDKKADLERVRQETPERVDLVIGLLGSQPQDAVEFFLAETGSSIYSENTSFARERAELPMTTLDDVLRPFAEKGRCLVKLDVQGAELDVLAGGAETLKRTDAVLLEASIVEYNLRAPRIADVIDRLRQFGFLLFDICDQRRVGPVLAQVDLIFAREGSVLDRRARETIEAYGR